MEAPEEMPPRAGGVTHFEVKPGAEELDPPVELEEGRAEDRAAGPREHVPRPLRIPPGKMNLGAEERDRHRQEAVRFRGVLLQLPESRGDGAFRAPEMRF